MGGEVVYRSEVTIVRDRGPTRRAFLPASDEPIRFGVHGEIAEHYGVDPDEHPPTPTTLDHVVAAAGG